MGRKESNQTNTIQKYIRNSYNSFRVTTGEKEIAVCIMYLYITLYLNYRCTNKQPLQICTDASVKMTQWWLIMKFFVMTTIKIQLYARSSGV